MLLIQLLLLRYRGKWLSDIRINADVAVAAAAAAVSAVSDAAAAAIAAIW